MNEKLKKLIFYKLYENLKHVEVIPHENSIWFIDTKQKYWYFEFEINSSLLWWRWSYFENYFDYFSLEHSDAEYVMSRWVEEVLNSKIITTTVEINLRDEKVEEVLNSKVTLTVTLERSAPEWVEEVLNSKVVRTAPYTNVGQAKMEKVLNSTVTKCISIDGKRYEILDEVLSAPIKKSSNSIKTFIKNLFNIKKFLTFTQTIK